MPRFAHSSRQPRGELGSPPLKQSTDLKRRTSCSTIDRTILLVDDDSAVRESLVRVLATEGWRIVSAANGEEALERLIALKPDLLITDLCMADVSGWDLLFHENLQRPALPIFVITALPPPDAGGADRFATEYFQKPLDLDALVAAIHRCLGSAAPVLRQA